MALKKYEEFFEQSLFRSRWLMAPFYIGLVIALIVLLITFGKELVEETSKVFTLVYNLKEERRLYQRFPGVEGMVYFIAGIGVNYERSGGVTLAPMRTGVGLRAGINAQYQVYTQERDWFPL